MDAIAKPARTLEAVAAEIRTFTASMLNNVIEIGRRFCEAKALVEHGQFGSWITQNTGYSVSTANNFMRLYQEYGDQQGSLFGTQANSQTIGNLSYSKALALLAVPAEERESFAESVRADELSVSELKRAIQERDEEKRRAREAERSAAENREAYSQAQAAYAKAKADLAAARDELEALKSRPVEVAVQTDPNAVEAARREAEEAMRGKLEKAKSAKTEAEQRAKDAEAALEKVRQEMAAAEEAAKEKLAAAQEAARKAEAGTDKDLAAFGVYFNEAQEICNKLHGLFLKIKGRDEPTGAKLAKAMQSLSEAIGRCAE